MSKPRSVACALCRKRTKKKERKKFSFDVVFTFKTLWYVRKRRRKMFRNIRRREIVSFFFNYIFSSSVDEFKCHVNFMT